MSIWSELSSYVGTLATDAVASVVETLRTVFQGDEETRRRVAFSVAIIALSAKMAKADGVVTVDEVHAFREIFEVPEEEFDNVSRLFDLAKRDIAGFDSYGAQVKGLFPGQDPSDRDVLQDVLDALFHIAKADGVIHENELLFLEEISAIFGFDAQAFDTIRMRHVSGEDVDPYIILGAQRDWDFARLRKCYLKQVKECHPDRLAARGVPEEFIVIANDRLAALNGAWETIQAMHGNSNRLKPATVS